MGSFCNKVAHLHKTCVFTDYEPVGIPFLLFWYGIHMHDGPDC